MATKKVEMAVRDPKTKKLVVDEVEVKGVTVNIRNRDRRSGGHVLNDVMLDEGVLFRPGEVKTLLSEALVAEIKRRRNGAWELTTAAPTPPPPADDEEDADIREPTSSEASEAAAAAAEQAEAALLDPPPRVERVARVQRRR